MKVFTAVLMVSATMLAGVAQAELLTVYPDDSAMRTQHQETRAQVLNELHAAQAAGLVSTAKNEPYPDDVAPASAHSK